MSIQCKCHLGRGSWGKVLAVRWQMGELDRNFITCKFQEKVKKDEYVSFKAILKKEMPKISLLTMQTSSGEELNIIGERCIAELLLMAVKKV